jgi:hypothetical protein
VAVQVRHPQLDLFHRSLERFGILALGQKGSIRSAAVEQDYAELDAAEKLYRRIG